MPSPSCPFLKDRTAVHEKLMEYQAYAPEAKNIYQESCRLATAIKDIWKNCDAKAAAILLEKRDMFMDLAIKKKDMELIQYLWWNTRNTVVVDNSVNVDNSFTIGRGENHVSVTNTNTNPASTQAMDILAALVSSLTGAAARAPTALAPGPQGDGFASLNPTSVNPTMTTVLSPPPPGGLASLDRSLDAKPAPKTEIIDVDAPTKPQVVEVDAGLLSQIFQQVEFLQAEKKSLEEKYMAQLGEQKKTIDYLLQTSDEYDAESEYLQDRQRHLEGEIKVLVKDKADLIFPLADGASKSVATQSEVGAENTQGEDDAATTQGEDGAATTQDTQDGEEDESLDHLYACFE